jgi:hypothetical protein
MTARLGSGDGAGVEIKCSTGAQMDVESSAEAYVSKLEQQNRYLRILLCLVGASSAAFF